SLAELSKASTMALIDYFGLRHDKKFYDSSALKTPGTSTQRLIDLCLHLNAKSYLTGHGAKHYLEHERFETLGIDVNYINYGLKEYTQVNGTFTPYVTALDLVANCGKEGSAFITGLSVPWRVFTSLQKDINHEEEE